MSTGPLQQERADISRGSEHLERQARGKFSTGFPDNRPQATIQRRLREFADNNPRAMQFKAMQAVIHTGTLQRVAGNKSVQTKAAAAGNNTGLPNQLKTGIESLSGLSMNHVQVHYNSELPAQLNAHAYTQGSEIHVAGGQEKHLPHEAWHVVQQAQGRVRPTLQMKDKIPVNNDPELEREADVMGEKALGNVGDVAQRSGDDMPMQQTNLSFSDTHTVQRKIGFEVELNTPWYENNAADSEFPNEMPETDGLKSFIRSNEDFRPSKGNIDESRGVGLQFEHWNREQEYLEKFREFQNACIASGLWTPFKDERGPVLRPELVTSPMDIDMSGKLVSEDILDFLQFLSTKIFFMRVKQGMFSGAILGHPMDDLRRLRDFAQLKDDERLAKAITAILTHPFDLGRYAHMQASMGFDLGDLAKMQDAMFKAGDEQPDEDPKTEQMMLFYKSSSKLIRAFVDLAFKRFPKSIDADEEERSELRAYLILCCESVIGIYGLNLLGAMNQVSGKNVNLMAKDAFSLLPRNSVLALYNILPNKLQMDSSEIWKPMIQIMLTATGVSIGAMIDKILTLILGAKIDKDAEISKSMEDLRKIISGEAVDFPNLDPGQMTKLNKMDRSVWGNQMPVFEFRRALGSLTFTEPTEVKKNAKKILAEIVKTLDGIFVADRQD
ncbi:eCIS core domain-containing protein [Herbaspirillum seropedicae]|uniref:eCIS core domain-containing protein n=1 Tax=Herbaspirillum seropedicae TaxID=964 RepID=UPI003FCDE3A7